MANTSSLSTTTSSTQGTTQNPQAASAGTTSAAQTSAIQPTTTTSLLNGGNGIVLNGSTLPSVTLGTTTASTQAPITPVAKHHINPVLGSLAVFLFVAAIVLFYLTSKSAKNTTN